MKLLIRNLNRKTSEAALCELVKAYGMVDSCDLVIDKKTGESKGFGFAEMPNDEEANEAIKMLNAKVVSGNKIRVKKADA